MRSNFIAVFQVKDYKGVSELQMMNFPDFITGWEWVQEHKDKLHIISFGENILFER